MDDVARGGQLMAAQDTDEIAAQDADAVAAPAAGRVVDPAEAPAVNGASTRRPPGLEPDAPEKGTYARSARILTIGIASTGIFTFLYLAFASRELSPAAYSRISLCWAIMFV